MSLSEPREQWASRRAFVLAAVGSAIGLGNLIRFPYVCAQNGGGAFLVAYAFAMSSAGLPLLLVELGVGHAKRGSAPLALFRVHPRLEWVGWVAAAVGFTIASYYAVIMAWAVAHLFDAGSVGTWAATWESSRAHFFESTLGVSGGPWQLGGMRWGLLGGFVLVWAAVAAAVWKGTRTVGKVVYATVLIPWALLLLLLVRAVTLPGASAGIAWFLTPDWSRLLGAEIWLAAYAQTFFSLSVGFAIMPAYASYLAPDTDLTWSAAWICLADGLTAFVGGLAVFSAAGFMAAQDGVLVTEVVEQVSGLKLAFVTYPNILARLPAPGLFTALFFLMLLTLGIDSLFSLVEAVTAALRDKWGLSQRKALLGVIGVGALAGLPFISGAGLYWIDTTDHFMNHFGLPIICALECVGVAWIWRTSKLREHLNERSWLKIGRWLDPLVGVLVPLTLLGLAVHEALARWRGAYGGYPRSTELVFGWAVIGVAILFGLWATHRAWSTREG